jgi:tripartite-type tricarboxylate transporter receptor subunit TctC
LSQVRAGKLIALAVTSKDRSPVAPDVPTIAESGYPGFDAVAWHGFMAPAGTPQPVIDRLNAEILKALKDPPSAKLIEQQAMQIVGNSPQEFAGFIKQDIELWKDVAKQAKVEIK